MRMRSRMSGERGAVLILVAVFAIVAVIFIAFVVDIGNQRQSRRQLATASDSVALAVAREWANAGLSASFDCDNTNADERLAVSNSPTKDPAARATCSFDRTNAPRQGSITVLDDALVDYAFEGATGLPTGSVGASSTVAIEDAPGGGLRPVGLCMLDPDLQQWVAAEQSPALKALPTYDPGPFDIFLPKFLNPLCTDGPAPGNWSQLILPGAGNGAAEFRDDVENGAAEDVSVNDSLPNFTGGGGLNSADDEFEALEGTIFNLPMYTQAVRTGPSPSDVDYPVAGFLEVRLIESTLNGGHLSFVLQPLRFQDSGACCFVNEYNAVLSLCDVGTIQGQPGSSVTTNCRATLTSATTSTTTSTTSTSTTTTSTSTSTSTSTTTTSTTTTTAPCTASAISPSAEVTHQLNSQGQTTANIDWTVTLANGAACANLHAQLRRSNGATALLTVIGDPASGTVTLRLPSGTEGLGNFKWSVELRRGGSTGTQIVGGSGQPTASLSTRT